MHYATLQGNPAEPDVWRRLDALLTARYGGLGVAAACVDSGNWASAVYAFTASRHSRRVWAIKGSSLRGAPLWPRRPSRPKPGRPPLYIVGTDTAKETVIARLSLEEAGPGCCHFPIGRDLDYFEMLTAEKPVRSYIKGVPVRKWVSRGRNEALDCRVYALAALHGLRAMGLDLDKEAARATPREVAVPKSRQPMIVRSNIVR